MFRNHNYFKTFSKLFSNTSRVESFLGTHAGYSVSFSKSTEPVTDCLCKKELHSRCYLMNFPECHKTSKTGDWNLKACNLTTKLLYRAFPGRFPFFLNLFSVELRPVICKPATPVKRKDLLFET